MNTGFPAKVIQIRKDVEAACQRSGRKPEDLILLAVSKKHTVEKIAECMNQGFTSFGENYAKELLGKAEALQGTVKKDIDWHFIGSLQSNKIKPLMTYVNWFHSIEKLSHVAKIDALAKENRRQVSALLQVNVSEEDSKGGLMLEDVANFLESCQKFQHIQIRGLMTFPPYAEKAESNRQYFKQLRELRDEMGQRFSLESFNELSMGVSNDYLVAIEEGATMVRLGRILFGDRLKK